jgi:hypothetical protein
LKETTASLPFCNNYTLISSIIVEGVGLLFRSVAGNCKAGNAAALTDLGLRIDCTSTYVTST